MQIIAYAWEQDPTVPLRVLEPLAELTRRAHTAALNMTLADLDPSDAEIAEIAADFDVAYVVRHREFDPTPVARRLHAAGVPVVADCDAADAAETHPLVAFADIVTTASERLEAPLTEAGAHRVTTIPTYLSRAHLTSERRPHDGVVLGCVAAPGDDQDWAAVDLGVILEELADDIPELRIEIAGRLDVKLPNDRCRRGEAVPYTELPRLFAGFDVAVAPLRDAPSNHVRSDIRLKEYAIAGVPWLASPVGACAALGENEGGRLVVDDDWYTAIHRLVHDKRARRKLGRRGQKWALEHTLPGNIHAWQEMFQQAIALGAERRAA